MVIHFLESPIGCRTVSKIDFGLGECPFQAQEWDNSACSRSCYRPAPAQVPPGDSEQGQKPTGLPVSQPVWDAQRRDAPRLLRFIRKDAAFGVDRVSAQEYELNLDDNIRQLVERLKGKRYRAKLVRRQYIPKGKRKVVGAFVQS